MTDPLAELVAYVRSVAARAPHPVVVGIGGGVAVGKSTIAAALSDHLADLSSDVVNADGFLFPNAVLAARGLESRKGFPESYDVERLLAFVHAVHSGAPEVVAPRYSHATYDVLTDEVQVIRQPKVLLIEGVVVLTAVGSVCDVTVYVHADEHTIEDWYRARFHALVEAARRDASSYSFYREFAAMTDDETDAIARTTWRSINLPNLREYIAPSGAHADVIIEKDVDHRIVSVSINRSRALG